MVQVLAIKQMHQDLILVLRRTAEQAGDADESKIINYQGIYVLEAVLRYKEKFLYFHDVCAKEKDLAFLEQCIKESGFTKTQQD